MTYANIRIDKIIEYIEKAATVKDFESMGLSKYIFNHLKDDPTYLFRMQLNKVSKINDYMNRLESLEKRKIQPIQEKKNKSICVDVVGIDLGSNNTITASDQSMKRIFIMQNERIKNAMITYEKTKNKKNSKAELNRAINKNTDKLINSLLNHYIEPVTYVIGEMNQSSYAMTLFYKTFLYKLKCKQDINNISVYHVDESKTSITCPKCGYKDKKNRKNNNRFECKECNFKCDNDDLVACVNIVKKYRVCTDKKVKQI